MSPFTCINFPVQCFCVITYHLLCSSVDTKKPYLPFTFAKDIFFDNESKIKCCCSFWQ